MHIITDNSASSILIHRLLPPPFIHALLHGVDFHQVSFLTLKMGDAKVSENGTEKVSESKVLTENPKYYKTYPEREVHEKFFRDVFEIILKDALFEGIQRDQPVVRFEQPHDLWKILNLKLGRDPAHNHDVLLDLVKDVIKYSVKTGHPYFINQLYSG